MKPKIEIENENLKITIDNGEPNKSFSVKLDGVEIHDYIPFDSNICSLKIPINRFKSDRNYVLSIIYSEDVKINCNIIKKNNNYDISLQDYDIPYNKSYNTSCVTKSSTKLNPANNKIDNAYSNINKVSENNLINQIKTSEQKIIDKLNNVYSDQMQDINNKIDKITQSINIKTHLLENWPSINDKLNKLDKIKSYNINTDEGSLQNYEIYIYSLINWYNNHKTLFNNYNGSLSISLKYFEDLQNKIFSYLEKEQDKDISSTIFNAMAANKNKLENIYKELVNLFRESANSHKYHLIFSEYAYNYLKLREIMTKNGR